MQTAVGNADREGRLFAGHSGRMLVLLSAGWLALQLGRQSLPPLLPAVIGDLAITPAEAGIVLTLMNGLYAAAHYPGGRFSDHLSRRTVLVTGLLLSAVGFGVLLSTASYPTLLVGAALVGIGAGLYFIAMKASVAELFTARRAGAFGINAASGRSGNVLAAGLAIVALSVATWQAAFLPVVALLVLVAAFVHRWARGPYVVARVRFGFRETLARVFGRPGVRLLVISYTLFIFTWQGVVGFLPTFLQVDKGFSPSLASGGFAMLFVIGVAVGPIAGRIGDRVAHIPVALGSLAVGTVGLAVLVLASPTPLVLAGIVVFAVGLMAYPPIIQAHLMDAFPDDSRGGDFGAFKTIYSGLGSLGPTYVGIVAGRAGYTVALSGIVLCLLGSAATVFWLHRAE